MTTTVDKTNLGKYKFICLSLFGVFMFFVKVPFMGVSKLPVDHVISFVDKSTQPFYPYITSLFALFCIIDIFLISKNYNKSTVSKVLTVFKVGGALFAFMVMFGIGPSFFLAANIAPSTSEIMTKSIAIILSVAIFLPFLVDFGLIDAVGIIVRPIMRPLFKIPGRTAVVAAGAFLGNFSIGLISTNNMYNEGKLTEKESVIVATGLSTVSIGLMMLFAKLTGIMDRWTFYFISSAVVCYLVTAISVRIPPISRKPNTYKEGVEPDPEEIVNEKLLKTAYIKGCTTATEAGSVANRVWITFYSSAKIIAGTISGGMFLFVVGLLLNQYTPIFKYLGMAFWPLLKISGFTNLDVLSGAVGLSILDVIPAVMIGAKAQALTLASRYFLASFPVVLIIFFGGFGTCILSTDVPVSVKDLFYLWFIRMILAIPMLGIIAKIFL